MNLPRGAISVLLTVFALIPCLVIVGAALYFFFCLMLTDDALPIVGIFVFAFWIIWGLGYLTKANKHTHGGKYDG